MPGQMQALARQPPEQLSDQLLRQVAPLAHAHINIRGTFALEFDLIAKLSRSRSRFAGRESGSLIRTPFRFVLVDRGRGTLIVCTANSFTPAVEFVEQLLCLFQIGCIEAFVEPAVEVRSSGSPSRPGAPKFQQQAG
jgi:hypothetical protein